MKTEFSDKAHMIYNNLRDEEMESQQLYPSFKIDHRRRE